ncbi:MAG: PAS domain-containing protein [bacterium]
MNDKDKLRRLAEAKFAQSPKASAPQTSEAIQQAFHELQVHQIELEMQNEELCKVQAQLTAERARYFDLYDLAPVGYIAIQGNGVIRNANLEAVKLLGMARGQLINHSLFHFIPKEEQDIYYLHHKQLVTTSDPQDYELRMVKQDGTVFWSQLMISLAQESDGALVCQIVLNNITARKQAEDALRTSELHMRTNADSAPDDILTMNQKGIITYWNPAAGRIFGYRGNWGQPLTIHFNPKC